MPHDRGPAAGYRNKSKEVNDKLARFCVRARCAKEIINIGNAVPGDQSRLRRFLAPFNDKVTLLDKRLPLKRSVDQNVSIQQ